ncbi:MAG: hypothetical protein V1678_03435 [Candidatus Aenigmatarchaeota archaeon]
MTLSFNYKTVKRPDGTEVKTPSIPITIKGKESIDTIALVDSGADISAIPKDVADILGLDIKGNSCPAFGIGGKTEAIDSSMEIIIEKGHEKYNFRIPVKIILGHYDFPILLGRAGFFGKFVISFDQSREKVLLKRLIRA